METNRVFITIALSIAILAGWFFLQQKYFPQPPLPVSRPTQPESEPKATGAAPGAPRTPTDGSGGAAAREGTARAPEQRTTVVRDRYFRAVFSTWGGAPVEFTLLHPQYRTSVGGHEEQINLVRKEAANSPFTTSFSTIAPPSERSDFDLAANAPWELVKQTDRELVYKIDIGTVHLEKKWELPEAGYRLGLSLWIENRGEAPVTEHLVMAVPGWHDPTVKPGGFTSFGRRVNMVDGECDLAGKLKKLTLDEAVQKPIAEVGDVKWIGIGEQFFLSALAFAPDPEGRTCSVSGLPSGQIDTHAVFAQKTLGRHQAFEYPMAVFIGPKLLDELDAVSVGGADAKLGDAVNYSLEYIARPMLWFLKKIQSVTRNWGLAIIVFTILMKVALFYPTQKSMQSAKAMAKLKPEIDRLKQKFGDDKQKFNEAQMKLFKERGINPLGGCLPMLLQMPIYIAFYSMLSNAVELYHASFIGPVSDMTAPFWPLPLASALLMFVQQKISPAVQDPQQRTMMYMMPVMMGVFTMFLPSGLTLYIFVNTLLSIAQQWWMNRSDGGTPVGTPARA